MTDKEIIERAKEAEKRTGFGKLVHSPISKGVNSAFGIGFIEGMVEYRNSMQEEPVSEDMWEVSKQYALRQVLASTDTEMSEQEYLNLRLFSGFELAVAHKDGANWQKRVLVKWLKTESDFLFKELHEGNGDLAKRYRAELYKEIIAKLKDM